MYNNIKIANNHSDYLSRIHCYLFISYSLFVQWSKDLSIISGEEGGRGVYRRKINLNCPLDFKQN